MNNTNIYLKKIHQSSMKTVIKVMSPYLTIQYHFTSFRHVKTQNKFLEINKTIIFISKKRLIPMQIMITRFVCHFTLNYKKKA